MSEPEPEPTYYNFWPCRVGAHERTPPPMLHFMEASLLWDAARAVEAEEVEQVQRRTAHTLQISGPDASLELKIEFKILEFSRNPRPLLDVLVLVRGKIDGIENRGLRHDGGRMHCLVEPSYRQAVLDAVELVQRRPNSAELHRRHVVCASVDVEALKKLVMLWCPSRASVKVESDPPSFFKVHSQKREPN